LKNICPQAGVQRRQHAGKTLPEVGGATATVLFSIIIRKSSQSILTQCLVHDVYQILSVQPRWQNLLHFFQATATRLRDGATMAIITFIGAAQQVTGSCYMVEAPTLGRVLLDCGKHQGADEVERNVEDKFVFDPHTVDALILSHAHIDHSGMIPQLVSQGFTGPIYCTLATAKLLEVMLMDSWRLYEKELEYENLRRRRRGEKPLKPVYVQKDVEHALRLCKAIRYRECLHLNKDASVCFYDAGHILGSAIVEVKFTENAKTKTLVFSGDLGKSDSVLMNNPSTLESADIVLMEGTYGNRNHRTVQETVEQLEKILHETWERKGNVLIPAFAVGRTQEILFHLGSLHAAGKLDNWQVYLDSPMAIEITSIYEDCYELLDPEDMKKLERVYGPCMKAFLPSLRYTRTQEESMAINRVQQGAIIIAGSGMCTGGRIRHHFKQRIWNEQTTIIFAGFQARGTLGRILVDGAKKITMFGDLFAVRARIETLGGFSAHAGQSELIDWINHFTPQPRVMLVHGEPETLEILATKLKDDKGIKADIPYAGQVVDF
jgi:metallo-beta-lactamase family protein